MYVSAPETGDQDTVLTPHSPETETLLGEQGPGEMEGTSGHVIRLHLLLQLIKLNKQ